MEKRIIQMVNDHLRAVMGQVTDLVKKVTAGELDLTELEARVKEIPLPALEKSDFCKRARANKTPIPDDCRCLAKRVNDQQCTRKRRGESMYCGTHTKGVPYGVVNGDKVQKKTVWAEDISGIIYYISNDGFVYSSEDVIKNTPNPAVIGTWTCEQGKYAVAYA
jgi:hypothetical protein